MEVSCRERRVRRELSRAEKSAIRQMRRQSQAIRYMPRAAVWDDLPRMPKPRNRQRLLEWRLAVLERANAMFTSKGFRVQRWGPEESFIYEGVPVGEPLTREHVQSRIEALHRELKVVGE